MSIFKSVFVRMPLVVVSLVLLSAFPSLVHAQKHRPRVGLVLSGGGAKGVAHIGVLKVLEEAGIPVDYISGTSMGAIIGGLYSVGYSACELDSMVRSQDWIALLTDQVQRPYRMYDSKESSDKYLLSISYPKGETNTILPDGMMRGQSVLNKFSDLTIGYHEVESFDSLPIPFACVAGDLVEGKEVVLRNGSLPVAMRASMAIPGAFSPVFLDGMVLIDGGIFNNFPVDVARDMGADITIGVDLSTKGLDEPNYHSMLDIADRVAFLAGEAKADKNVNSVDLYMNPGLKGFSPASFNATAIDTMIVMGERVAREHWDEIMALKARLEKYGSIDYVRPEHTLHYSDTICVSRVEMNGLETYNEGWVKKVIGIKESRRFTVPMLEDYVQKLQGTGLFSTISYEIVSDGNGGRLLRFVTEEKSKGTFNVGMHIDTEDVASVLVHTQYSLGGLNGSRVFATARVNHNPWLNLGLTFNTRRMRSAELSYRLGYADFRLLHEGDRVDNLSFLYNNVMFSMREYFTWKFSYRFGLQYEHFSRVSRMYRSDYSSYTQNPKGYVSCFLDIGYDSFDDLNHPTHGVLCNLNSTVYRENSKIFGSRFFGSVSLNAKFALSVSERFCILPELSGRVLIGDDIPGFYLNYAGGEFAGRYLPQQMSFYGMHHTELFDNSVAILRLSLRYMVADKHYISLIGNYAASGERIDHIFDNRGCLGGALKYSYDSIIGPLSLILDYSGNSEKVGFYANIGYYF